MRKAKTSRADASGEREKKRRDSHGNNIRQDGLALGAKLAQAAKDYLVTLGILAGRISTNSYGEEIPVCREHNEACWQKNRCGRFVVLKEKPGV